MKTPISEIMYGVVTDSFDRLKENGILFRASLMQISKHFLNDVLDISPFNVSFSELRLAYVNSSKNPEDKVPILEEEFHEYICKQYFQLIKEPRIELLNLYDWAISDLKQIDETLNEIESKIQSIKNNNIAEEVQEQIPLLSYYKVHNERARDEIMQFLKENIKIYALQQSYDQRLTASYWWGPYNYRGNKKAYKPKPPDDLINKFGGLSISELNDLRKIYKEDKPKFEVFLKNFIIENGIVFSLLDILGDGHILSSRQKVLTDALDTYEVGNKTMFANAVPTIIEGIFHDLCLEIGIDNNLLLHKGFQFKLEQLNEILDLDLHYEYFAFRFRLFRNKVAHGRMTENDAIELADMLLLDLYDVCKLTRSMKLRVNQKRFLIKELNTNKDVDYNNLLAYLLIGLGV